MSIISTVQGGSAGDYRRRDVPLLGGLGKWRKGGIDFLRCHLVAGSGFSQNFQFSVVCHRPFCICIYPLYGVYCFGVGALALLNQRAYSFACLTQSISHFLPKTEAKYWVLYNLYSENNIRSLMRERSLKPPIPADFRYALRRQS